MPVPKIVHQTWKNKEPHSALRACVESFQFMNPDWDVRYYTDDECLAWIKLHCSELMESYLSFPIGIHRADLFRILVLYFEGGVYADLDVECIRPLDELISRLDIEKSVYLTRDHPVHERIHFGGRPMYMNDFMIAEPHDPLIEEILKWMLRCPPTNSSSANAVMDTGPGVMSSVIEMLGGPEQFSTLQVMPTPWIHPLPDMNCKFHESQFYQNSIASRDWLNREVFVVHYWFHTWVGTPKNMLVDFSEVLLSTIGEQVERKLQWKLGPEPSATDCVIACALAEFAETNGTVILYIDRIADPLIDRFLELLREAGLKPKLGAYLAANGQDLTQRLEELQGKGVVEIPSLKNAPKFRNACSSKVLLVSAPDANLDELGSRGNSSLFDGFLLGPPVGWANPILEEQGLCLSEIINSERGVPRIVHLFPGHTVKLSELVEQLAAINIGVREWRVWEVDQILSEISLGTWDISLFSDSELKLVTSLAVLSQHGGIIFDGNLERVVMQLQTGCFATFSQDTDGWHLACPQGSGILHGALMHWHKASKKGMKADLLQFIQERVKLLHQVDHLDDIAVTRVRAHGFLP